MSDIRRLFMDRHPEHCAALGRLVVHWAHFERNLIWIMKYLLDTDIYKAVLIFDEFNSIRSKITLLLRINHRFTYDEILRKDIEKHLKEALELTKKRNAFIHAIWDGDNRGVMRRKMIPPGDYRKDDTPFEIFNIDDIQNVVEEIAKLHQSFVCLIGRISEAQQAQP